MIYIIPDSNHLYISYDNSKNDNVYDHFFMNQNFEKLMELQNSENCIDEVQVLIPEMVFQELLEQKVKHYEEDLKNFAAVSKRLGYSIPSFPTVEECRWNMEQEGRTYLESRNVVLVPVCSPEFFAQIVNKAIKKEPPFEGADGKSDKGFKDTVIFFSLVEYARGHKGDYYILTKDGIFGGKNPERKKALKRDFYNGCSVKLEICTDIEEISRRIMVKKSKRQIDSLGCSIHSESFCINKDMQYVPINIAMNYPEFQGEDAIIGLINEEIQYLKKEFLEFWDSCREELPLYESEMEFDGCFNIKVHQNTDGILSFVVNEYSYLGGIHGGSGVSAYTYDLNVGCLLNLRKLLCCDEEELARMINDCVNEDIRKSPPGKYYEEEVDIVDVDSVIFYVDNFEVHIVFNEYDLAPYSEGIIDLVLTDIRAKG